MNSWEKIKNNKKESCLLSFFKNKELFLECAFVHLPGVAVRSEFPFDYSLQLTIVTCSCASVPGTCSLSLWLDTVFIWFLTLSINCLMLWKSWPLHETLVHLSFGLHSPRFTLPTRVISNGCFSIFSTFCYSNYSCQVRLKIHMIA